ncbi:MAG TPA: ADP-ribosylglycohydrolase family protein [Candidatus Yaniella excrementigallinarum]|nr:ADP-ribosylglycohydrolase family protein [Candidatus Yaniella excrementigallinarum]
MDNFSSRMAGAIYGGAAAEAAAVDNTDFSTGTQLSLYVADGLLEVLEWATDGQAADPPASIWLALLRWYKNRYGAVPEDLPVAQDRWIDAYPVDSGEVEAETKTGLEQPEMGLPRKPHGEAATGVQALVRAAPLGMLPQVEADWVTNMSHQVAVLTHGDWQTPAAYSLLMHHIFAGETFLTAVSKVISWLTDHDGTQLAERIRTSLAEEISAPTTAQDVLAAAIRSVTDGLEQPVAPEQLFSAAITAAVHRGGNTAGTALLAGQLIGGLLGNTATGTPSHLDNYLVLEELVDRWVRLTT